MEIGKQNHERGELSISQKMLGRRFQEAAGEIDRRATRGRLQVGLRDSSGVYAQTSESYVTDHRSDLVTSLHLRLRSVE